MITKHTLLAIRERALINRDDNALVIELCTVIEQLQMQKSNHMDLEFYFLDPLKTKGVDGPCVLTARVQINGRTYDESLSIPRTATKKRAAYTVVKLIKRIAARVAMDFLAFNPQVDGFLNNYVLSKFEQ